MTSVAAGRLGAVQRKSEKIQGGPDSINKTPYSVADAQTLTRALEAQEKAGR